MGMGYAGGNVITIEESVVAQHCPEELKAFKELVAKYGCEYSFLALDGQNYNLDEKEVDELIKAHEKLTTLFREKTKLEICYFYHNSEDIGDRYDEVEEAWQVVNAYQMTEEAKPFSKYISNRRFVMFG